MKPSTRPPTSQGAEHIIQHLHRQLAKGEDTSVLAQARALTIEHPDLGQAWKLLGIAAQRMGSVDEALAAKQRSAELLPRDVDAQVNLGNALRLLGRLPEAEATLHLAISLRPDCAEAHNLLALVLQRQGRIRAACASFQRALRVNPNFVEAHSNLLFMLTHEADLPPAELLAAHRDFETRHGAPLRASWRPHVNERAPGKRLRVGFVSGDFRNHAVARFIAPIWRGFDRSQLELHAYHNHRQSDRVTVELKGLTDRWTETWAMDDDAMAEAVRRDGIDILFDLSGHTAHHRLLVFARKPAPIQVTAIGYPHTTGLAAMDYRITDRFRMPPQLAGQCVERLAWIPCSSTFEHGSAPEVSALPALRSGRFTFGSFQRPSKIGPATLALWGQVLRAVPQAQLLLGAVNEHVVRQRLTQALAAEGVEAERICFHGTQPMNAYLALHGEIDLLLDTVPYPAGTTAHHGVWMGVPTLTRTGDSIVSWQCAAVLGRLGLNRFIAHDDTTFVALAQSWASNPEALAALRRGLREQVRSNVLLQPTTVALGMQAALREMWRRWCASEPPASFEIHHA